MDTMQAAGREERDWGKEETKELQGKKRNSNQRNQPKKPRREEVASAREEEDRSEAVGERKKRRRTRLEVGLEVVAGCWRWWQWLQRWRREPEPEWK